MQPGMNLANFIKPCDECPHAIAIKLFACVVTQILERVIQRPRALVRARIGQRVKDIRNRQDTTHQRDIVTTQTRRVALAIDPLMMCGHHATQHLDVVFAGQAEFPHHHLDHLQPFRHMPLGDEILLGGQFAGLEQYRDPGTVILPMSCSPAN